MGKQSPKRTNSLFTRNATSKLNKILQDYQYWRQKFQTVILKIGYFTEQSIKQGNRKFVTLLAKAPHHHFGPDQMADFTKIWSALCWLMTQTFDVEQKNLVRSCYQNDFMKIYQNLTEIFSKILENCGNLVYHPSDNGYVTGPS